MKCKVLVRALLMGIICPAVIYLAAAAFDVITQESKAALYIMLIEGVLLLLLPVFFLWREKVLDRQFSTKLTAPAYLLGYAVITLVAVYITDSADMEKLFGHKYLGGIGLVFMYMILAAGLGWAVLFRIGAAVVSLIKKKRN